MIISVCLKIPMRCFYRLNKLTKKSDSNLTICLEVETTRKLPLKNSKKPSNHFSNVSFWFAKMEIQWQESYMKKQTGNIYIYTSIYRFIPIETQKKHMYLYIYKKMYHHETHMYDRIMINLCIIQTIPTNETTSCTETSD